VADAGGAVIPTLLVVGFALGAVAHGRHRAWVAVAGLAAAVAWGVAVGVGDGSAVTGMGGAALALLNLAVGAVAGAAAGRVGRTVRAATG
jgi:hypothetical protein